LVIGAGAAGGVGISLAEAPGVPAPGAPAAGQRGAAAPAAGGFDAFTQAKIRADEAAAAAAQAAKRAATLAARNQQAASRSQPRVSTTTYPVPASCNEYSGNRALGCALLLDWGFELDQMPCLERLWTKESGWNHRAVNRSSGAYGIPQALPGDKMAAYGQDWQTNPVTQIKWGLNYIENRYRTPCGAWAFFQSHNWY
jgi:hypothetical protein